MQLGQLSEQHIQNMTNEQLLRLTLFLLLSNISFVTGESEHARKLLLNEFNNRLNMPSIA